jgi:lambda repressor-like predicted transcriptional regulator
MVAKKKVCRWPRLEAVLDSKRVVRGSLARELGIAPETLCRWLRNGPPGKFRDSKRRRMDTMTRVQQIAHLLGVQVDEIWPPEFEK